MVGVGVVMVGVGQTNLEIIMNTKHWSRIIILTCIFLLVSLPSVAAPQASIQERRCFRQADYCIEGRIRTFWEQNGGLVVFGYPITMQHWARIEGKRVQVQWFERNRLELHPESQPPYDVLIGRLGVEALEYQNQTWQNTPTSVPEQECRYFAETGYAICGEILRSWKAIGLEFDGHPGTTEKESLALFGLPISPLYEATIAGQSMQVQWFERARFELHPENDPPYHVLLGLLGKELLPIHNTHADMPPPALPLVRPDNITRMPDLIGMDRMDAQTILERQGIFCEIDIEYRQDRSQPYGYVIQTEPEPGARVQPGVPVTLVVIEPVPPRPTPPPGTDLPDLVGKTKLEAVTLLEEQGIAYRVVYTADESQPRDMVWKTEPGANSFIPYGEEVTLYLYEHSRNMPPSGI